MYNELILKNMASVRSFCYDRLMISMIVVSSESDVNCTASKIHQNFTRVIIEKNIKFYTRNIIKSLNE